MIRGNRTLKRAASMLIATVMLVSGAAGAATSTGAGTVYAAGAPVSVAVQFAGVPTSLVAQVTTTTTAATATTPTTATTTTTTTTPSTTTTTAGPTVTIAGMSFGGTAVSLTLDKAVTQMQTTGSSAETAALNKKSDEAVARGYKEDASSISDMLDMLSDAGASVSTISAYQSQGTTAVNEKVTKLRRDFAKDQITPNYQAELNEIEANTVEVYYGILQAEENLRVAKDSLANAKTIYTNTMKKYNLGTAAKIDTLTANTSVISAEAKVKEAETAVAKARMNFNLLLGFDLLQNVTFTDTLKQVAAPTITLEDAVKSAVASRNEIKGSKFAEQVQGILLENMKLRYSTSSSTYLTQQAAYLQSQKTAADAPLQIELDIRAQYMDLADKKRAIETAQATLSNAKEAYRLAGITYNAGMNTLTDVQDAEIAAFQAGQAVNAAIAEYDLAVKKFEHAIGAGTTRITL